MWEKRFRLKDNGTTPAMEFMGGLITFLSSMYIIVVNPAILSQTGMPSGSVYIGTVFCAAVCTFVMGFFVKIPVAMAAGMGTNSLFAYTICMSLKFTWQEALAITLIASVINLVLISSPFRYRLLEAIPKDLRAATAVGLGMFIALMGLKNAGLIEYTIYPGAYTENNGVIFAGGQAVHSLFYSITAGHIVALIGLVVMTALLSVESKTGMSYGAVPVGILVGTFIGIPLGVTDVGSELSGMNFLHDYFSGKDTTFMSFFDPGGPGLFTIFESPQKATMTVVALLLLLITSIVDPVGTFIGIAKIKKKVTSTPFMTNKDHELFPDELPEELEAAAKASEILAAAELIDLAAGEVNYGEMPESRESAADSDVYESSGGAGNAAESAPLIELADDDTARSGKSPLSRALKLNAVSGILSSLLGTSPTTAYIESAAGISAGGRTGLSAVFTALLFFLCIPLYSLFQIIPAEAIAPALIVAGAKIFTIAADIKWKDIETALPAFLVIAIMPMTYSIADGVIFGLAAHVVMQAVICGHRRNMFVKHLPVYFLIILLTVTKLLQIMFAF